MFPFRELSTSSSYREERGYESFSESDTEAINGGLLNISGSNPLRWEFIDASCAKIVVEGLPKEAPEEVICYVRRLIIHNTSPAEETYVFTFTRPCYADWFEHRHGI